MIKRLKAITAFTVVELLVVILIIALLIAILLPALARAREAARTVACANNERNLGLAIFQYAERYGGCMPSAFYNTFHYLATYLGDRSDWWDTYEQMASTSDVWRCGSDQFLGPGCFLEDEQNQCSYAPNADRTGVGLADGGLDSDDWAGWSVQIEVEPGVWDSYGASFSPFSVKYKGCDAGEQAVVKLGSVATDTVLIGESWRDRQVNALYLDTSALRLLDTYVGPDSTCSRDSLLLVAYTSGDGVVIDGTSGDITDGGPFSFMKDVAEILGDANRPYTLEDAYHLGRINVLYADGHVNQVRCKTLTDSPGGGRWAGLTKIADIPYWNRNED